MGWSAETMERMDSYRTKFEQMTKRKISQSSFGPGETHLPTWLYTEFLEQALVALEKKNMEKK